MMIQEILVITVAALLHAAAHNFGYEAHNGPNTWSGFCQIGKRQSPVDVKAYEIDVVPFAPLLFMNYEHIGDVILANNGHTVIGTGFKNWNDKQPYISGGGLNGTYKLSQFHFHWAQQNNSGSEHTIASLHYPSEIHLVHLKEHPAPSEVNTIAVVGIFVALGSNAEPLQILEPYISDIKNSGTEKTMREFSIKSFLPAQKENFYRYEGSLTTPSCNESVIWTLMADPITITPWQLQAFREVQLASGKTGENLRPTQPLNGRRILFRSTSYSGHSNAIRTMSVIGIAWRLLLGLLIDSF